MGSVKLDAKLFFNVHMQLFYCHLQKHVKLIYHYANYELTSMLVNCASPFLLLLLKKLGNARLGESD